MFISCLRGMLTIFRKLSISKLFLPQSNSERFEIYKDWDSFPSPVENNGRKMFYSERSEVNKLAKWILDSNGGSVLVSGVRGAGKTAFVYYSIYVATRFSKAKRVYFWILNLFYSHNVTGLIPQVFAKSLSKIALALYSLFFSSNKLVFVPVNMAALEHTTKIDRRLLLSHLIHSYYYSSSDAKKSSRKLYLYSISKSSIRTWEAFTYNLNYYGKYPILIIGGLILLLLASSFIQPNFQIQVISKSLSDLRVFLFSILGLDIFLALTMTWLGGKEMNLEIDDKNFNYLQMEFQKILSKSNKIYIFVIDEIDKLDESEGEKITTLFKDLKNLLTISSGRFIFITSEKYFDYLSGKSTDEDPYPITSTIFNWKIFLPQARIDEIKTLVISIMKNKLTPEDEEIIDLFTYYIYAKSGGIFSEVKNIIRDFVRFEDGGTYLLLDEKTFDFNKRRIARLGLILNRVYEQRYSDLPSFQRYNNQRHEVLFPVFNEVIDFTSSRSFSIDSLCSIHEARGYRNLNQKEQLLIKNDVRDLLSDIKLVATHGSQLTYEIPEDNGSEFLFSLTISQIQPNLKEISKKRDDITEAEKELKEIAIEVQNLLLEYNEELKLPSSTDILEYLPEKKRSVFESARSLAAILVPGRYTSQEEVRNRTEDMIAIKNDLITNKLKILETYIYRSLQTLETVDEEEIIKNTTTLDNTKRSKLLNSAILFKYKSQYLIITPASSIKRLWERIYNSSNQPIMNVLVVLIEKDLRQDLLKLGFQDKNIKYIKIGNNYKNITKLIGTTKEILNWKDPNITEASITSTTTTST